ncbi:MAG: AAA family ATPase [Spirulina sp.]
MKIESLTIENFRGIETLNLKFSSNEPTVLIGINGSGKSTILDCLFLSFSKIIFIIQLNLDLNEYNLLLEHEPEEIDERLSPYSEIYKKISEVLSKNKNIKAKYIEQKQDLEKRNPFKTIESEREKRTKTKIQIFFSYFDDDGELSSMSEKLEELDINNFFKLSFLKAEEGYCLLHLFQWDRLPLFIYYPVNRLVLETPLEIVSDYNKLTLSDAYEKPTDGVKINFDAFFRWFRGVEDLENEERRDDPEYRDKQLEAVRKAIKSLIPGFANLRVRRSPLRMTVNKNEEELTINQLSDGEKCLLAMVGDLARRLAIANPGLEEPLQGEGVVLIYLIEKHLNPQLQI